jgi:hypothetical protein
VVGKVVLVNNAEYTQGIINKESWRGKGHHYIDYSFIVNGLKYYGSMPIEFCWTSKANCSIGDTVIVRYRRNHPTNNDLVQKIP